MIGFACRSHGARCTRATAFSIHVWSALLVAPAVAAAQTSATYLAIGSDAGDSIGRGQPAFLDASNASFSGTRLHIVGFTETTDKIDITVQPTGVSGSWRIVLTSPPDKTLGIGEYSTDFGVPALQQYTMSVASPQASCGTQNGRFSIAQLAYSTVDGSITSFALDFQATCLGTTSSVFGQLRIAAAPAPPAIGNPMINVRSPVAPGTPIVISLPETAGAVPLESRLWRFKVSTQTWTMVQDYAVRTAWQWTPTAADVDDYDFQVWVRSRGSTAAYDDWRGLGPVTVSGGFTAAVALVSDLTAGAPAGRMVTWSALGSGGSAQLQYRFWKQNASVGGPVVSRDWSTDPVWRQQTTPLETGHNSVIVEARSGGSTSVEASTEVQFDLGPPPATFVLATSTPTEMLLQGRQLFFGDTAGRVLTNPRSCVACAYFHAESREDMTITLVNQDALPPRVGQYAYAEGYPVEGDGAAGFSISANFGSCGNENGSYRVLEAEYDNQGLPTRFAADIEHHCDRQAAALFTAVRLNSAVPLFNFLSFRSNSPTTVGPGAVVTWTADASSGSGAVEYRFFRYSFERGSWTMTRDWSTDPRWIWSTTSADYGTYYIQVWARTVGWPAAYQAYRTDGPFAVAPSGVSVYRINYDAATARAGGPIAVEAIAGGGTGSLEYKFYDYNSATGLWSLIRDFAAQNTVSWVPSTDSAGQHVVQVWVREAGSTAVYDAFQSATIAVLPARWLMVVGAAGDPVTQGQSVTLQAALKPFRWFVAASSTVFMEAPSDSGTWDIHFATTNGQALVPGEYNGSTSALSGAPYLHVDYSGRCTTSSQGRFVIHEFVLGPDTPVNTTVARLAVDFEQTCSTGTAPLFGGIRYNSTVPIVAIQSFQASAASTTTGLPVTLSSVASSSTGPVEYRFWLYRQETGIWSMIRDYAAQSSMTWTATQPGSYLVQVWVRRQGTAASYEAYTTSSTIVVR